MLQYIKVIRKNVKMKKAQRYYLEKKAKIRFYSSLNLFNTEEIIKEEIKLNNNKNKGITILLNI